MSAPVLDRAKQTRSNKRVLKRSIDADVQCYCDPLILDGSRRFGEWIYVAVGSGSDIKIGKTCDVKARNRRHRGSNNHIEAAFCVAEDAPFNIERQCHALLSDLRIKDAGREWFRVSDDVACRLIAFLCERQEIPTPDQLALLSENVNDFESSYREFWAEFPDPSWPELKPKGWRGLQTWRARVEVVFV